MCRHCLHTLVFMLFCRSRYLSTDVGNLGGFFALSSLRRRQGDKASIDNPLNDPSFDAVDRTGLPTFGGRPLFRVVDQISNECQIAFPVIGASLFIFVPCF